MGLRTMMALVRRELIASLRMSRSLIVLALVLFCCMFGVVAVWPTGFLGFQFAADTALQILFVISVILMTGAGLFVPALAAVSVVGEKERGTLDLLRGTLIRPMLLVLAKWFDALGLFMLVVIGVFPMLGVVVYGIGLEWWRIVGAFLIVMGTAGVTAALGMAASSLVRRSSPAIFASYLAVALFAALPALLALLLFLTVSDVFFPGFFDFDFHFERFLIVVCPPCTLLAFMSYARYSEFLWWLVAAYDLLVIAGSLGLARWGLFREGRPSPIETEKPIDDAARLLERRKKFPYYLIDPLRRKGPIPDGVNPMRVRELRWGLLNRSTNLVRLFYCSLPLCLLIAVAASYDNREYEQGVVMWLTVEMALLSLVAPALLANTFTKEYEMGNFDMIRLTLLSPRDVVFGKIIAGVMSLAPVILGALLTGLIGLTWTWQQAAYVLVGHITLLVVAFLSLGLGLVVSIFNRRTVTALVSAYFAAIMLFGGVMAFLWFLIEVSSRGQARQDMQESALLLSPIGAFINVVLAPDSEWSSLLSIACFAMLGVAMLLVAILGYRYRYQAD